MELVSFIPAHIKFWMRITWLRNILSYSEQERSPKLNIFAAKIVKEAVLLFKKECCCKKEKEAVLAVEDWIDGEFTN